MRCPTCHQTFAFETSEFRPFCSRRCKLIDLGKWLDGDYAVPGEPASEDEVAAELQNPERDPRRH